jgi:hypothetical protein
MSRLGKLFRAAGAAVLAALGGDPALAEQPAALAPYPEIVITPPPAGRPAPPVYDPLRGISRYSDAIPPAPAAAGAEGLTAAGFGKPRRWDCTQPCLPGYPPACPPGLIYPGTPTTPPPTPATPSPVTDQPVAADTGDFPDIVGRGRGAGAGPTVGLNGYIENAAPVTMFRLRYDSAYGNNRPDRAEYFYAKCGCFQGLPRNNPLFDPRAKGPPLPETNVDYQEVTPYFEYAFNPRLSAFVYIPVRFINPQANANAAGLSDISFGTKYAFIYNPKRIVSFLLQAYAPSGIKSEGLGNGNWWLEPGLLWLEQMSPRWQLFGEFRDKQYLGRTSDFTGNVMRYGLGTSYMVAYGQRGYIAPVAEAVGWTVLDGKELTDLGPVSAAGDTIVNAKIGVRIGFGGATPGTPYPTRSDLYIGYGRALTGAVWYKDLLRVEYRFFF